jgi:hypothetical protein
MPASRPFGRLDAVAFFVSVTKLALLKKWPVGLA